MQARDEIDGIAARSRASSPSTASPGRVFNTVGLQADGVRQMRPVAARAVRRRRDPAADCLRERRQPAGRARGRAARARRRVRLALGAGRGRLVRQCLVEGLLLAALGAAAGVLVGRSGCRRCWRLRPDSLGRLGAGADRSPVLAFTAGDRRAVGPACSRSRRSRKCFDAISTDALQQDGRRASRRACTTACARRWSCCRSRWRRAAGRRGADGAHVRRAPAGRSGLPIGAHAVVPDRAAGARYATPEAFNAFDRRLQAELPRCPASTGGRQRQPPAVRQPAELGRAVHLRHRAPTNRRRRWPTIARSRRDSSRRSARSWSTGRFFTEDDDPRASRW